MPGRKSGNSDKNAPSSKPRIYHLLIFGGAVIVLVAGAFWQGGASDQAADGSEVTALEALKKEVSGVQSVLSRNELEVIRDAMTDIPKEIAPSIVGIRPPEEVTAPFRDVAVFGPNSTFSMQGAEPERLGGMSGLLIDKDGHVVTSARVLQYKFPVQISFGSSVTTADMISADSAHRIALLKLRKVPPGLIPVSLNMSARLESGEWLVREGRTGAGEETRSLHFLESTLTTKSGETIGLLNTQGAAYMDGAALINASGSIVGVYLDPSDSGGYVLPIGRIMDIAAKLKANPMIASRGWVGLELQEWTADLKEYFSSLDGVLISSVVPESPAAKAGLRPMDIIETVGDAPATSPAEVMNVINQREPGTSLAIGIRRNSRQQKVELSILPPPGDEASLQANEGQLALRLRAVSGEREGAEILSISPRSDANGLGVRAGDIILAVEGRRVLRPEQFWSFQKNLSNRKSQLWSIQRGDKQFFVAVKQQVSAP